MLGNYANEQSGFFGNRVLPSVQLRKTAHFYAFLIGRKHEESFKGGSCI